MSTLRDIVRQSSMNNEEKKQTIREVEKLKIIKDPENAAKPFNKLVICKSRGLLFDELILLNKMFSVLEFKSEFHGVKTCSELLFECLILDFTKKSHMSWFLKNKSELKKSANIVNIAIHKKHLGNDAIVRLKKTFDFDSVIKDISGEFITSGAELLVQLLIDHQSLPASDCLSKAYRLCTKKKK